jgi:hypothetical protein
MLQELQHLQGLLPYFILLGGISAYIAHFKKQRNPVLWFFIGFFFGLLGLFSLFFLNAKKHKEFLQKTSRLPELTILVKDSASLSWYYVNKDLQQEGPASGQRIADLIQKNILNEDTLVWNEHFTEWKKIKEVPEYIQILKN